MKDVPDSRDWHLPDAAGWLPQDAGSRSEPAAWTGVAGDFRADSDAAQQAAGRKVRWRHHSLGFRERMTEPVFAHPGRDGRLVDGWKAAAGSADFRLKIPVGQERPALRWMAEAGLDGLADFLAAKDWPDR